MEHVLRWLLALPQALMIKRELAKDPALAQENWDRCARHACVRMYACLCQDKISWPAALPCT